MSLNCLIFGHNWLMSVEAREFVPVKNVCLRCSASQLILPTGECLGGHPIAEHYDKDGRGLFVPECTTGGPQ